MRIFSYRHTIRHLTILTVLTFFLTTCSSTRFIYTFVDEFIKDEVNYFFDLDDEEDKLFLNQQVSAMVNWHRTSMLPKYADYLNNIADKLEDGQYTNTYISKYLSNGKSLIEETITGLIPHASRFLIQYQTVETIELIENKMLNRRQERIIELSKPDDFLYEKRLERLTSNFERFFGELKDSQVRLLEKHTRKTLYESRVRLHNRTLRQKVFIRFLKTQPTEVELTTYLNKLLLQGHMITNPSYQTFSKVSLDRFHELLVSLLAISSTVQRETIVKKLRKYANDFIVISELRN
jgi:hypothetical protein